MQQYQYVAINLQKEQFKGKFIAKDEADLAEQLNKQGLFLVSAKPYTGATPSSFFTLGTGKVTLAELTTFCRQFAIMINSGISILGSLDILKEQHYSSFFKSILVVMTDDVRGGMMFSEALAKHKKVFPAFFQSMISVGENSGRMDVVLNSLADYYERDAATRRKTKSAFSYPLMLAGMTIGIVIVMLLFVVPTFRESLSSLEVPIEGITKVVYDISDFLLANWMYILLGLVLAALVIFATAKTTKGHFFFDTLKCEAPFIKKITIANVASRFARGFGLLLSSGMDITAAMENIVIVFGNDYVEARFKKATEDVRHGMGLAVAFDKYKLFPEILTQMVAVGEKTNALDDVLTRTCDFFDQQVEDAIASITSKIQPVMLGLMGGIIGLLFIAIYSPMLSIMQSL